jgi:hypothetical protein
MNSLFQSLFAWLKGRRGPHSLRITPSPEDLTANPAHTSSSTAKTDDGSWSLPPSNLHDSAAWNQYWQRKFEHLGWLCFFDLFSNDRGLVEAMRSRSGRTVLCVGNGVSMEPRALAAAGFEVTALDLSSTATDTARSMELALEALDSYIDPGQQQPGGSVQFVAGDLFDQACPGPFDMIIERRTVQLFDEADRTRALESLVGRLGAKGILFSQCHAASWRPPGRPVHAAEAWFRAKESITVHKGRELHSTSGQVAWLLFTTG